MSPLGELQEWYAAQCNGDWEHSFGIRIESLDNPGWLLRIDLAGTGLESGAFEPILTTNKANGWADMRITNGVWQAACDPNGLETAIRIFLDWARHVREEK